MQLAVRTTCERGNLTTDARTISGHTYTTGYTFESAGRLSGVTYASSGWLATYSRDAAGQVSAVTATQPGHSPTNIATSVTHMPFGPVSGFTYGNGVTDTRTYDLDYRTTAIKDHATAGDIQYSSYGYDADNNVTSVTDHVTPGWTQGLTYDAIDQINYASGPYGVVSQIKYDSGGNMTKYDTTTYTSNRLKQIGGLGIVYNSAGNMTSGVDSSAMTYNKAGQLASVTVFGNTLTYKYDAFGWRVKSLTNAGIVSVHQYDQAGNYLERSASNVLTDYVWLDDANERDLIELAMKRNGPEESILSMILTADGMLGGRIWLHPNQKGKVPLRMIRVMGRDFRFHYPERDRSVSPAAFHRQALAFGQALNQDLANLRVAVIGCGGTGSAVATLLARLGVGQLVLIDNDIVDGRCPLYYGIGSWRACRTH